MRRRDVVSPRGFIKLPLAGSRSVVPALCECGHAPRRHLTVDGCGVDTTSFTEQRAAELVPFARFDRRCPCLLSIAECHFVLARQAMKTNQQIILRRADNLPLLAAQGVHLELRGSPRLDDLDWVVQPHEYSHLLVLFDRYVDALEFAIRDW